jgi:hypothetical protein
MRSASMAGKFDAMYQEVARDTFQYPSTSGYLSKSDAIPLIVKAITWHTSNSVETFATGHFCNA